MVSGLSEAFARMKTSSFTASLRFGLRILSRIPVGFALVPRVGLSAGKAGVLGVHVDQLLAFVPLGRERGRRRSVNPSTLRRKNQIAVGLRDERPETQTSALRYKVPLPTLSPGHRGPV